MTKTLHHSLYVIITFLIAGCTNESNQQFVTAHNLVDLAPAGLGIRTGSSAIDPMYAGLFKAYSEITADPADQQISTTSKSAVLTGLRVDAKRSQLSNSLKQSTLIQKWIHLSVSAIETRSEPEVEFDRQDFEQFTRETLPQIALGDQDGTTNLKTSGVRYQTVAGATTAAGFDAEMLERIQKYLILYCKGKYIDRNGRTLSKPEVKNGVNNDTITGLFSVVFDAVADSLFKLPVFFEDDHGKLVCLTATGQVPSAVTLDATLKYITSDTAKIEKREVAAIAYLSNLAGEQSKVVSGFVFRLFSDVEIGFVVGGDFAIGDHETLAKLIDTFFEVGSRRATEGTFVEFFNEYDKTNYPSWMKALLALIDEVEEAESLAAPAVVMHPSIPKLSSVDWSLETSSEAYLEAPHPRFSG